MTNNIKLEKNQEEIIRPELNKFLNSISVTWDKYNGMSNGKFSGDLTVANRADELFYEKYKDRIWLEDGKLYQVSINTNFDSLGGLTVYEVNPKFHLLKVDKDFPFRENVYMYSYWLLLGVVAVMNSGSIEFLVVIISLGLFIFYDRMAKIFYRVRFFIKK